MTTTTHRLSVPAGRPASPVRRAQALLLLASALLTGCAQMPPMVEQLQADQKKRIRVLVEDAPFKYTVPAAMDVAGGGFPLLVLAGALVAVSVQNSLENANARLATAAAEKKLPTDHRQAFLAELVRRLALLGVSVDVVAVPFVSNSIGGDRRMFKPSASMVTVPTDDPVFVLNLDVGTCTFGAASPCVRYFFFQQPTPAKPQAPANSDVMRNPVTPATAVRYRGAFGTAPDYAKVDAKADAKADAPEIKRYKTIDEAVQSIAEFDAQLSKIVLLAVADLVRLLEPRAPETTPATKVVALP
jgi:hypothetical protein